MQAKYLLLCVAAIAIGLLLFSQVPSKSVIGEGFVSSTDAHLKNMIEQIIVYHRLTEYVDHVSVVSSFGLSENYGRAYFGTRNIAVRSADSYEEYEYEIVHEACHLIFWDFLNPKQKSSFCEGDKECSTYGEKYAQRCALVLLKKVYDPSFILPDSVKANTNGIIIQSGVAKPSVKITIDIQSGTTQYLAPVTQRTLSPPSSSQNLFFAAIIILGAGIFSLVLIIFDMHASKRN